MNDRVLLLWQLLSSNSLSFFFCFFLRETVSDTIILTLRLLNIYGNSAFNFRQNFLSFLFVHFLLQTQWGSLGLLCRIRLLFICIGFWGMYPVVQRNLTMWLSNQHSKLFQFMYGLKGNRFDLFYFWRGYVSLYLGLRGVYWKMLPKGVSRFFLFWCWYGSWQLS